MLSYETDGKILWSMGEGNPLGNLNWMRGEVPFRGPENTFTALPLDWPQVEKDHKVAGFGLLANFFFL